MPEHTCGGFYDLSCEACFEQRLMLETIAEEYPLERQYEADYDEFDVVGGL